MLRSFTLRVMALALCALPLATATASTTNTDGTIEVYVWDDWNADGKQNGSEPGLSDVTVRLLRKDGRPFPDAPTQITGTTNASGIATLTAPAGDYKLQIDVPADHAVTKRMASGISAAQNSDIGDNGITNFFTLAAGQTYTDYDAGLWSPGQVITEVWDDRNGDGKNNGSEPGIAGVPVKLLRSDGRPFLKPDGTEVTGVTNAAGEATLDYVPANINVGLFYELPADHKFTTRNSSSTNDTQDSDAGDNGRTGNIRADRGNQTFTNVDAGMWAPGTVETYVWDDRNGDGKANGSEPGLSGVDVQLIRQDGQAFLKPDGSPVTATTGIDGIATLDYLPADRAVALRYTLPADHKFTGKQSNSTNDTQDSDPGNDGRTRYFRATRGSEKITNFDAGMWAPGTAEVEVWFDANGDGKKNGSETEGIYGVRVNLLEKDGRPVLKGNRPVTALAACGTNTATLDYVPADRELRVEVIPFAGGVFSPARAFNDTQDSDIERNNRTRPFRADRGSQVTTNLDAGFTTIGTVPNDASVVVRAWNDTNGNGIQNGNEQDANIEGVKVNLLDATSREVCACVSTGADGLATVPAISEYGRFLLEAERPADHKITHFRRGNDRENSDFYTNGFAPIFRLTPGEVRDNLDVGFWAPGSVVARVWNDANGNGIQNGFEGDSNLVDVPVTVLELDKTELINPNTGATVTGMTGADGTVTLPYVPADRQFRLRFDLPADHKFTPTRRGGNGAQDSDAYTNGITPTYRADRGSQLFTDIDAGLWAPGSVVARVWDDLNGNGIQNGNEADANLSDVTVTVMESNGQPLINPNTSTPVTGQTGTDGTVTLNYTPADRAFRLKFDLPADHRWTPANRGRDDNQDNDAYSAGLTNSYRATQGSQRFTQIDAGVWAPGSVVARVWDDLNGNGIQNGNEADANVAGVTVTVMETSGQPLINPTTNATVTGQTGTDGTVTLDYTPADRGFRLKFDLPVDHRWTRSNQGRDDNQDNDAYSVGLTGNYRASQGSQQFTQIDAGVWAPGSITARVWNDLNGNGIQNGNEADANLAGVTVTVIERNGDDLINPNTGESVTGMTGPDGLVTLPYTPANRQFHLKFDLPADHKFTGSNKGGNDTQDSDAYNNGRTPGISTKQGSQVHTSVDAGLWAPGSVVTRTWVDANGNGIQNNNETDGLYGLEVQLVEADGTTPVRRPDGSIVKATTQCGDFTANLDYVPADRTVRLLFDVRDGARYAPRSRGGNRAQDSDIYGPGLTTSFRASRGSQLFEDVDAGFTDGGAAAMGNVIARVWDDQDGDGVQDATERDANLEGIKVSLIDANTRKTCSCTTTDAAGLASLSGLVDFGQYRLKVDLPADHKFTNANRGGNDNNDSDTGVDGQTGKLRLTDGGTVTNFDAGLWAPGTLTARVWNDADGDGKQDGSENDENIEGILVSLVDIDKNPVFYPGTTTPIQALTDADGEAFIDHVPADRSVRLFFAKPLDTRFTASGRAADKEDNDAGVDGFTGSFRADRGSMFFKDVDAGIWSVGTAVVRVWNDVNMDGIQQGSENNSNIEGAVVTLLESNPRNAIINPMTGAPVSATTQADGLATLDYVPTDRNFRFRVELPDGFVFTSSFRGTNSAQDSDFGNDGQSANFNLTGGGQTITHVDAGAFLDVAKSAAKTAPFAAKPNQAPRFPVELSVFPNPATELVNVRFELAEAGEVSLRLVDLAGREVARSRRSLTSGSNQLTLELPQVPNGTYIVELIGQDLLERRKIMVTR
ncbi:SdrD B-like domain-containing protein [Lewinella sp. 4G2]|uniref:SdrD B-like domain-containing protein n=1 Tax=Lewinella sp. 4G2 TaxID=1803372 RepID=UPI0007B4C438|nr:SdrD B-like domain-containing protein [Lewinella sp. 4G2]OAV43631.1 hypothetical protein A3850_003580 [Lewinella sp. 4G2]